ncbi:MAG: hypothetical protein AABZ12_05350 [Planctomycetota bacterium]
MPRPLAIAGSAAAWIIFAAAIAWPAACLVAFLAGSPGEFLAGVVLSPRQWTLLAKSASLAVAAAIVSTILAAAPAYAIGLAGRQSDRPLLLSALWLTLLFPPMVYAFGWERVWASGGASYLRCMLIWSLWSWPIPAMILGGAWSRQGRAAFEAALLHTHPLSALFRVVLPAIAPHAMIAILIVGVLCFNDYAVPHACGLTLFSTELLGIAMNTTNLAEVAGPAAWPVALTLVAFFAAAKFAMPLPSIFDPSTALSTTRPSPRADVATILLLVFALPVPTVGLLRELGGFEAVHRTIVIYAADMLWSMTAAGVAGTAAVAVALNVLCAPRAAGVLLGLTFACGSIPGALIGTALVRAYNRDGLGWVYDDWLIVALGYVARFAWIAMLVAWLVAREHGTQIIHQARLDGASKLDVAVRVLAPMRRPLFTAATATIAALALAEVPTTSLVRSPGFNPVAMILIDKFHRLEDDVMIALSLFLMVVAFLPAFLLRRSAKAR